MFTNSEQNAYRYVVWADRWMMNDEWWRCCWCITTQQTNPSPNRVKQEADNNVVVMGAVFCFLPNTGMQTPSFFMPIQNNNNNISARVCVFKFISPGKILIVVEISKTRREHERKSNIEKEIRHKTLTVTWYGVWFGVYFRWSGPVGRCVWV